MDKLTVISGALFLAADIFAIVSLALPDWITSEVGGDTRLGLMSTCMTIAGRSQTCFSPSLHAEWFLTLVCIIVGSICVTATVLLLITSHWDVHVIPYARWVGFSWFCTAWPPSSSRWASTWTKSAVSRTSCPTATKLVCPIFSSCWRSGSRSSRNFSLAKCVYLISDSTHLNRDERFN